MFDPAIHVLPLLRSGESVAIVTIAGVAHSAPRGVGASMAVTADGAIIGSISGGCIESDAGMLALAALASGTGRRATFGFSDDTAHAAGLACGGSIDVVAYPISTDDASAMSALAAVEEDRVAAIGVVASGPRLGALVSLDEVREHASSDSRLLLDDAVRSRASIMLPEAYDGDDVLVLIHAPRPRLIILGGGEHAAALCRVASAAGYAVSVCDVWDSLVTEQRFPDARDRVTAWPHEYLASLSDDEIDDRTAICVLTHDTRQDIPALRQALSMPVGFVGAMGARSTVAVRADLLRAQGVSELDLARLHSPLGLDLGGSSPDETAVSVLAEIVASRHGGTGAPLRETTGALHRDRAGLLNSVTTENGPNTHHPSSAPATDRSSCSLGAVATAHDPGVTP